MDDEDEAAFLGRLADFPDDYDWGIIGETSNAIRRQTVEHIIATPSIKTLLGKKG